MMPSAAVPDVRECLTDQEWQTSNTTSPLSDWTIRIESAAGRREFRFPLDGRELMVEIERDSPAWVEPTVQSLAELLQLEPDWDTYGSPPIDPSCVIAALELIFDVLRDDTPAPSVVPTSRGGLQLEWHTRGVDLEVEFVSPTRVCGLFEDAVSDTSWEEDLSSDLGPLVKAISVLSQRG